MSTSSDAKAIIDKGLSSGKPYSTPSLPTAPKPPVSMPTLPTRPSGGGGSSKNGTYDSSTKTYTSPTGEKSSVQNAPIGSTVVNGGSNQLIQNQIQSIQKIFPTTNPNFKAPEGEGTLADLPAQFGSSVTKILSGLDYTAKVKPQEITYGTQQYNNMGQPIKTYQTQTKIVKDESGNLQIIDNSTVRISPSKTIGTIAEFGLYATPFLGEAIIISQAGRGVKELLNIPSKNDILKQGNITKFNLNDYNGENLAKATQYNSDVDKYVSDVQTNSKVKGVLDILPLATLGGARLISGAYGKATTGLTSKELKALRDISPESRATTKEYYELMLEGKNTLQKTYNEKYGLLGNEKAEQSLMNRVNKLNTDYGIPKNSVPTKLVNEVYEINTPKNYRPSNEGERTILQQGTMNDLIARQNLQKEMMDKYGAILKDNIKYSDANTILSGKEANGKMLNALLLKDATKLLTTEDLKALTEQSSVTARTSQFIREPINIYGLDESNQLVKIDQVNRLDGFGKGSIIREIDFTSSIKEGDNIKSLTASGQISPYTENLINKRLSLGLGKESEIDIYTFESAKGRPKVRNVKIENNPDVILSRQPSLRIIDLQKAEVYKSITNEINENLFTKEYYIKYNKLPAPKIKDGLTDLEFGELYKNAKTYELNPEKGKPLGKEVTREIIKINEPTNEFNEVSNKIELNRYNPTVKLDIEGINIEATGKEVRKFTGKGQTRQLPDELEQPSLNNLERKPTKPFEVTETKPEVKQDIKIENKIEQDIQMDTSLEQKNIQVNPNITPKIYREQSIYAGKGTYELSSGGLLPNEAIQSSKITGMVNNINIKQDMITIPSLNVNQRIDNNIIDLQATIQNNRFNSIEDVKNLSLTLQKQELIQSPAQINQELQTQSQINDLYQSTNRPKNYDLSTSLIQPPKKLKEEINLNFELENRKKKGKSKPTDEFTALIKRQGQFKVIGKAESFEEALSIAERGALNTLGQTIQIAKGKDLLTLNDDQFFRKAKNNPFALVQRTQKQGLKGGALGSRGEKEEIKMSRRYKGIL